MILTRLVVLLQRVFDLRYEEETGKGIRIWRYDVRGDFDGT